MSQSVPDPQAIEIVNDLSVGAELHHFIETEALPGTGIDPADFWSGLSTLLHDFGDRNRRLLEVRADLQASIDAWHREHRGSAHDPGSYRAFLEELGYLIPEGDDFEIETENVDPEIATLAGPQLVVPVTNARYALNAANARWGSLYDALYGTDAMGDRPPAGPFDETRGGRVIAWARRFLDDVVPLAAGSHADATAYRVVDGALSVSIGAEGDSGLATPGAFSGYRGDAEAPEAILLTNNGLGIEIVIDRDHNIGSGDAAGVADVYLESAVTAIIDCEDSVAAVDAEDKALVYRNWLGLRQQQAARTEPSANNTQAFASQRQTPGQPDRTIYP